MKLAVLTVILLCINAQDSWAQSELYGTWKIVESSGHNEAQGEWEIQNVQPSLVLFQDTYYSWMSVSGNEARPLMADGETRASLSEEQMHAIYDNITANTGTYEVSGSTLTIKPMVALSPNFMEGGSVSWTYSVENDMLTLSFEGESSTVVTKFQRLR